MDMQELTKTTAKAEEEFYGFYGKGGGWEAGKLGRMLGLCDVDALALAMCREKESYRLYDMAANNASGPGVKAMFRMMAKEEGQHYEILEQIKYYLEELENWSIWEDGGPIEGG